MFDDLNGERVAVSFVDPTGGTTTIDPVTQLPVFTPSTPITQEANLIDLSPSEKVARSQLQDNSKYKLVIIDNTENRTIDSTFEVTINSIKYRINGKPKHPKLGSGIITVYISEV